MLSDLRTGLPTSAEERNGADGAVAFLWGAAEEPAARIVAWASTTAEFLDRWRLPGQLASSQWEERFGLEMYMPLIQRAVARALQDAEIDRADHVIVSSPHLGRRARPPRRSAPPTPRSRSATPAPPTPGCGWPPCSTGRRPGRRSCWSARSTGVTRSCCGGAGITDARRGVPVAEQPGPGREVTYAQYLTWRGLLEREPPRRPEPDRPAGPPAARAEAWKFAFVGSACTECGQVHVPPRRVCAGCAAVDKMERRPLADSQAPSPPTRSIDSPIPLPPR